MNFREIFWFPFCPHHGKSDTDRMFRVLRQFVTVWIRTYTLEEAKELRTCFVKSVKINNEIRKSKGKSTKVSKFHFFYKFEQKIESYTQKVLRHSNCQIFTEIFSTRSLGLRSRTSVLPYLYTSTFEWRYTTNKTVDESIVPTQKKSRYGSPTTSVEKFNMLENWMGWTWFWSIS